MRCPSPLLLGQSGDELTAEGGDVGDDAAPDQVRVDRETVVDVFTGPLGCY